MKAAVTAGLCLSLAATAHAANTANAGQEARMLKGANITLPQAIRTAEMKSDGQAIGATYDTKHGNEGRYEVLVMSADGSRLTRLDLDAYSGAADAAWNHSLATLYPDLRAQSVLNTPTPLANAIRTAERRANGKATDAQVQRAGAQLLYTVDVARPDGTTQKVEVDGSDGAARAG